MNKLSLLLLGTAVLAIQGCAPLRPSTDSVALYTFERAATPSPDSSKSLVEKYIGARDADLYRSPNNTVHYVSKSDVTETFEFDVGTGNLTFNKSMKKHVGGFVPQLPTSEQSVALAQTFLRQNDIAPLDGSQLKLVHLGGLRSSAVVDGKRAGPVINELVTVNFGRVVDGIPVIGPGSKIVVKIGDKGEVMGMIRRWRELDRATRVTLRPEELVSAREAEELARRQIIAEYGEGASFRILGSGKRYFDNNGGVLQPVYAFEVAITMKDPKVQPFNYLCVVSMLRSSPEPLNLTAVDPMAKRRLLGVSQREPRTPALDRALID
jgi:hypothetical protein